MVKKLCFKNFTFKKKIRVIALFVERAYKIKPFIAKMSDVDTRYGR